MRYEEWKYHPSRLPDDKHDRERLVEELQEQFYQELLQNPKTAEFLKPYRPGSGEYFLKQYATQKRLLVAHSEFWLKQAEKRELRHREETEDAFKAILQKKILNMELLWRAEQISIPGIEASVDFYKWYGAPKACPFIEPVTTKEIETMQRFLARPETEIGRYRPGLGVHSGMGIADKGEGGPREEQPEWFEYYDTYMGTAHLLLLPDTRGMKEAPYRSLEYEERKAKNPEHYNFHEKPEFKMPMIDSYSPELHYQFSKLVDDEVFQHLFYYQWQEKADEKKAEEEAGVYDADDYVTYLANVPDPPLVRGGVTWREALHYCWTDYLKRVISENLPSIWEEYKFYLETGLNNTEDVVDDLGIEKMVREQILRGRDLAGEPRDFNF